MENLSYLSNDEFELLTKNQRRERSILLSEKIKGMDFEKQDEFFENRIHACG